MFTGTPEELRKLERKSGNYADQIHELLRRIEDLGLGQVVAAQGRIEGPGFTIRRGLNGRWSVQS